MSVDGFDRLTRNSLNRVLFKGLVWCLRVDWLWCVSGGLVYGIRRAIAGTCTRWSVVYTIENFPRMRLRDSILWTATLSCNGIDILQHQTEAHRHQCRCWYQLDVRYVTFHDSVLLSLFSYIHMFIEALFPIIITRIIYEAPAKRITIGSPLISVFSITSKTIYWVCSHRLSRWAQHVHLWGPAPSTS